MTNPSVRVELHRHLDCAMRPSTLRELLEIKGELQPQASEREFRDRFLIEQPMVNLKSVLEKFTVSQTVLESSDVLRRLTRECLEDAVKDGIRLIELRFAPTYICDNHPDLNFERVLEGILEGREQCRHLPIEVGLIAIIQRTRSVQDAEQVLAFVLANRRHFVGIDLADQEEGFDAQPFEPLFRRAHDQGLGITIHAGESPSPKAAERIRYAVEHLHASRIGHGIQCIHSPELIDWLIARDIHLEICPTSNVLTQSVRNLAAHPVRALFEQGVSLSINTDDPGIFNITLANEYQLVQKTHGFSDADFARINSMACQSSFLPEEIRTMVSRELSKSPSS